MINCRNVSNVRHILALQDKRVADSNCTTVLTNTTDDATLNPTTSPYPLFTTNITGLFPGVTYTLRVYPYNEGGVGAPEAILQTTKQECKFTSVGEEGCQVWDFCRQTFTYEM